MEERKIIYLNRVIDYLVDDTIIDYEINLIYFPFLSAPQIISDSPRLLSNSPHYPRFLLFSQRSLIINLFSEYCKEDYGLIDDEIQYVWDKYGNIILDKINSHGNINESVDRRSEYLDSIIGYLVEDTIINYENDSVYFPFIPRFSFTLSLFQLPFSSSTPAFSIYAFLKYCEDTYGLNYDEVDYVWEEYRDIILNKINNRGSINESVDRRSEYLDSVIDYLVEDTIIDYENNSVYFPFSPTSPLFLSSLYFVSLLHSLFSEYCKDTYGLSDNEINYVWDKYKNIILNKINNRGSINESMNRRSQYVDRVIVFLLQDTIINYEEKKITYPFYFAPAFIPDHLPFSLPDTHYVIIYCRDVYGLTDDEIKYVWDKYKNIILNEVNSNRSLN